MTYDQHLEKIEEFLYNALQALDNEDLIAVRHALGDASSENNAAWKERRKVLGNEHTLLSE